MLTAGQKNKDKDDYLNLPPPTSTTTLRASNPFPQVINNYQKRLLHQIVRKEYPHLTSIGRGTFIQLIPYDEKREEGAREDKARLLRERIAQQTGFRWIVEGMVGGDISSIEKMCFLHIPPATNAVDGGMLSRISKDIQKKLKARRPALVGHNIFTDLINFYKCFIGDLPECIEDFQELIHELFPLIIDTKYMATYASTSANFPSSLGEINDNLSRREMPTYCTFSSFCCLKFVFINFYPQSSARIALSILMTNLFMKLATTAYSQQKCCYDFRGNCIAKSSPATRMDK